MIKDFYTVQEVANLLDMHVKTVRNYLRRGQLGSTRVGKRYRVSRQDLEAFMGAPVGGNSASLIPSVEVSSIVQIDGVGTTLANRITNLSLAAAQGHQGDVPLRIDTLFDEERARLKVIVFGSVDATTTLLELVQRLCEERGI